MSVNVTSVFKEISAQISMSAPLTVLVMRTLLAPTIMEVSNATVSQDIMVMAKLVRLATAMIDHARLILRSRLILSTD